METTGPAHASIVRETAERDRLADERDHLADLRDRTADERERLADERERLTDALELLTADERRAADTAQDIPAGVRGSRLRLLESERGLESARATVQRSQVMVSRQRVALTHESNDGRRQQLAVAQEMVASQVTAQRDIESPSLPTP